MICVLNEYIRLFGFIFVSEGEYAWDFYRTLMTILYMIMWLNSKLLWGNV